MSVRARIIGNLKCLALIFATGYLFFGKWWCGVLFLWYLFPYNRNAKKVCRKRRQSRDMGEFKDGMLALNSALAAGYSVENAFRKALEELRVLYGRRAGIVRGFEQIVHRLELNGNVEDALEEFAKEINVEDALYFAEVFRHAKKSGGDLPAIIRKTAENLSGKLEVKREIETLIAGKRMEQKIMNLIPFAIIFYIRLTAPEFVEPLYGNLCGVCIMTGCLAAYAGAVKWSEKIMEIEV